MTFRRALGVVFEVSDRPTTLADAAPTASVPAERSNPGNCTNQARARRRGRRRGRRDVLRQDGPATSNEEVVPSKNLLVAYVAGSA